MDTCFPEKNIFHSVYTLNLFFWLFFLILHIDVNPYTQNFVPADNTQRRWYINVLFLQVNRDNHKKCHI